MARQGIGNSVLPCGQAVNRLVDQFATLPGIGRKTAERLTHHVLASDERAANELADAIRDVKATVHPCRECYFLTEDDVCPICSDSRRNHKTICVVEQPRDVISLEASGVFDGVYHVLQGRIAPLDGVGAEDLTVDALIQRIRRDGVTEVVMATNPTTEGDGTALYISNILSQEPVRITRLARGIASGSVLEFANREMLADAIRGRRAF